jgi:hypothetical protein
MFFFLMLTILLCILWWLCKKLSKHFGEVHQKREEYQSRLLKNLEDIRGSVVLKEDEKSRDLYAEISQINAVMQAHKGDQQAVEDLIREASTPNT